MKINAISMDSMQTYKRLFQGSNKETVQTSDKKDIRESNFYPSSYYVAFSRNSQKDGINYKLRRSQLKDLGLSKEYIDSFLKYPTEQYEKALKLLEKGCDEDCAGEMSKLPIKNYNMAVKLVEHNVIDESLYPLVKLNKRRYNRVIKLKDKGIDAKDLEIFAQLTPKQYTNSKRMMREGYYPIDAAYLSTLNPNQRKIASGLMKNGVSVEIATNISTDTPEKQQAFQKMIDDGIDAEHAEKLIELNEEEKKQAEKYVDLGVGYDNAADIAILNEKQRTKADLLLQNGVHPDYIEYTIKEEEKAEEDKNLAYKDYRERGYSRTASFSMAQMRDKNLDDFIEVMNVHPELNELLYDEYEVNVVVLQGSDVPSAILTKQKQAPNGTIIKFVHTFDSEGNHTFSRSEEYKNHETSSCMQDYSDVFRLKYDEYGDIKEMTEFIQHPETRGVTGVLHSVSSKLLPGVFETVYYDINDFKTDNDDDAVNANIKDSVKNGGIPISTVKIDSDGKLVFKEKFSYNSIKTAREYTEKKDKNGIITESSYSIEIKDETGNTILNTSRSYSKIDDNNAINVINGIKYNLKFNNEDKTVTITDGKNTKTLCFNDKLAYYSKEHIWKALKQLPVDTLLTIDKNVKQWNYCKEENSIADGYCDILSTGNNSSIITHETGHFKDYEINGISNNKKFLKIYAEEMQDIADSMPYNEYDFITYLSPRADLIEVCGNSEFVAEANIILNSYGTSADRLKTRSQFLLRYFPKSIAKVAELSGKTSTKSLLEK